MNTVLQSFFFLFTTGISCGVSKQCKAIDLTILNVDVSLPLTFYGGIDYIFFLISHSFMHKRVVSIVESDFSSSFQ